MCVCEGAYVKKNMSKLFFRRCSRYVRGGVRHTTSMWWVIAATLLGVTDALRVAVVGAHGHLGRELVQQSLDRNWSPVACVRRRDVPVRAPCRRGWLSPENDGDRLPVLAGVPAFVTDGARTTCPTPCHAVIFAMSGAPFEAADETTDVVRSMCATLPLECRKVCLVSAHGVGDSLAGADVGIQAMRAWYLKSTYRAKGEQEKIVHDAAVDDVLVVRPRVLSFAPIPWNPISRTRQDLATELLDWIDTYS